MRSAPAWVAPAWRPVGRVVVARAGMAGECGLHGAQPRVCGAVLQVGGELREVGVCQQQRFGAAGRVGCGHERFDPGGVLTPRAAQDPRYVRDLAYQPVVLCGGPPQQPPVDDSG